MKVGKEIRPLAALSTNVISSVSSGLRSRRYGFFKFAFLGAILLNIMLLPVNVSLSLTQAAAADTTVSAWWPSNGAHVGGTQPFKAVLNGADPSSYEMFWQVDGGTWNWMDTNTTDAPHKEARVSVSGWNWKGSGPYKVNFIARQNGVVLGQQSVDIYVGDSGAAPAAPAQPQAPAPTAPAAQQTQPAAQKAVPQVQQTNNSLAGVQLYVNPHSPAKTQANAWSQNRSGDANKMNFLASQPTAAWFGNWNGDVQGDVSKVVSSAQSAGQTPVLVAYNIPGRDCGGYSSGGSSSRDQYTNWIGAFARGIGGASAIVVLEPDALAGITCLSSSDQQARTDMLASAVSILKSNGNTRVYLDAGHSGWVDPGAMGTRLQKAGITKADGFALNVSNFNTTGSEADYGAKISAQVGHKHFIVDTSRNGNGASGEWCNPWGRAVGNAPTTSTGNNLVDAYLWIKTPGESDGNCNGGPSAGQWWPEYALSLVK